jgi:hypothetical protein
MVRYNGSLGWGWFRGANVHAAIHLHRINRHDFAVNALGEKQRDFRFSTRCWSCERDDRRILAVGGTGHEQNYAGLTTGRGSRQNKSKPAPRMKKLIKWAGVAHPPK